MTTRPVIKFPALVILMLISLSGCLEKHQDSIYQKVSNYDFEDSLLNLDIAISEHNYRIIHRSHIGQAVRDRGDESFPLSTITSFCNITYAKEMMEINSNLINDMPCNVSIRESEQGVIVSTKLMNTNTNNARQNEFAQRINDNLKSIVEATAE